MRKQHQCFFLVFVACIFFLTFIFALRNTNAYTLRDCWKKEKRPPPPFFPRGPFNSGEGVAPLIFGGPVCVYPYPYLFFTNFVFKFIFA